MTCFCFLHQSVESTFGSHAHIALTEPFLRIETQPFIFAWQECNLSFSPQPLDISYKWYVTVHRLLCFLSQSGHFQNPVQIT